MSASDDSGKTSDSTRPLVVGAALAGVALLLLQVLAAARLELTFDEAYYTLWSRALSAGYLDHPPMVALWIRASTSLFGASDPGMRALSLILTGALPALIGLIAWRLFGSLEVAALAALCWVGMPLAAAGVFVTPDDPLVVFWTLGLAALVELWHSGRARWLIAFGVALGLGLESKFTAAFLAAGAALAFVVVPSLRRWLRSLVNLAALIVAAAIFAPFVLWNAEHGWATFAKQLGRAPPHGFAPGFLAEFVAAQIGLINPLIFAALVGALASVGWRGRAAPGSAAEARRLLAATIAPALLYFALHALHDRVQGNWPAPLYPAAAVLAAEWIARQHSGGLAGVVARAARWAAPLGLAVACAALLQASTGLLPLGSADPTARLGGYRELAAALDARARAEHAGFVLTQGYALTSLMTVYGDPAIVVAQPDERLRWIFAPEPAPEIFAAPGLALGEAGHGFDALLKTRFRIVKSFGTLERSRAGRTLGRYDLYRVAEPIGPVLDPA